MGEQGNKAILEEIADRKGYDTNRMFWEGHWARYLRWGEASHVENPAFFDRRFPEVPTFEYRLDHTFPTVTFLKSYLWDEWDEHLEWYRELTAPYAENKGLVRSKELPAFIARRDALQKQIIRNGERLQPVFEEARAILKVWVVEAEQGILQGRKSSSLSDEDEEILDALYDLKDTAKQLWNHVTRGTTRRALKKNWLPKALYREGLPRQVAEAQGSGVRLQLLKRDRIIEETIPIHRRWWALEVLLKRALIGEPVLTEDELRQERYGAAHDHTMHMGKKVHEYRQAHEGKDHGEGNPHLFRAGKVKDWLLEDYINPVTGEPYSRATITQAGIDTGQWVNTKQGSSEGLKESLDNLEEYYLKHRAKSEKEA